MNTRLDQIRQRLLQLSKEGTSETGHSEADSLLIEVIGLLSQQTLHVVVCQEIVEAYNEVGKWYA